MLTYTFTKREKALLLVLALVVVVIVWFVFVYQSTANRVTELDSEIATVNSEITTSEARVAQLNQMRTTIDQRKAAGVQPTVMPAYDNMRSLMVELNKIMSAADTYTLSFDQLALDEKGNVERGVRVDYGTASIAKAESIVRAFANGTYPCRIDSVAITDTSGRSNSRTSSAATSKASASIHVTFFESVADPNAAGLPTTDKKSSNK